MLSKVVAAESTYPMAIILAIALTTPTAIAATSTPSGGEVLRNIERTTPTTPMTSPEGVEIEIPETPALSTSSETERVSITGYRITGNTVFTESTLLGLINKRTGDLSLSELRAVAETIAAYYRDRGYLLALAYLPEQEIDQGMVTIAVLEGRYDQLLIDNNSRIGDNRLNRTLAQAICSAGDCRGALIHRQKLERGLLILNDLPGAHGPARLSPGKAVGTSQLDVNVDADPLVEGALQLDNQGNYYSGANRAIGTLWLNNPWGIGDQVTVQGVASEGHGDMQYGLLAYGMPIGYSGLRANVSGSYLQYELGGRYEDLKVHGTVKSADVALSYPFIRSLTGNLLGDVSYGERRFHDDIDSLDTDAERRITNRVELGLNGDLLDNLFGLRALNTLSMLYNLGKLELDDATAEQIDAMTARSDGSYNKWMINYSRLQSLFSRSNVYVRLSAQGTDDNLDSYEKFALGGPYSVRAYPTGETLVDEALLFSVEWRQRISTPWGTGLEGLLFYDRARGRINADPWTNDSNHVTL
ncbi:MAG TPA: ShlB/FhaC/HecB family hemolysin secretion/activation protein, partial [Methylophilaceae bacterium]|nr:ShlB/FhaC/HecB family hemolysin secretion/activation protein [Methylophilaceae bacterium]